MWGVGETMNLGYLLLFQIGCFICFMSVVIFESKKIYGIVVFLIGLGIILSSMGGI